MKTFLPSLALLILTSITTATFNLNTAGPDWSYVTKKLANTTSDACKSAYSASISCDVTLLGLVASMRPAFKPTSSDLDNTCTTICSASLESYIQGVKKSCTAPGDKANESIGGTNWGNYTLQPVELVGEIFQYTFSQSCRKRSNGTYCYGVVLPPVSAFSCDNECATSFYQMAHDYSASGWSFNSYFLVAQSEWWLGDFKKGWTSLQKCGTATGSSSSMSSSRSTSTILGASSTKTTALMTTASAVSATSTNVASGSKSTTASSSSVIASATANAGGSFGVPTFGGAVIISIIYTHLSL
ncbi:hypothetical protein BGZ60DRAFT_382494 [Tricladium varicosporioides]|nr:hypothetical protein BGZ60DRAFT_382494 [Hymenoscyphus varicosporioides]